MCHMSEHLEGANARVQILGRKLSLLAHLVTEYKLKLQPHADEVYGVFLATRARALLLKLQYEGGHERTQC